VNPTWLLRNLDSPLVRYDKFIEEDQSVRPALWSQSPEVAPGTRITISPLKIFT
jgi:hypothetical protein